MIKRNLPLSLLWMLIFFSLLSACTPVTETPAQPPAESTAAPSQAAVSDALQQDAITMAEQMGISLDEALRRLDMQDDIGQLNKTLTEQEADTYGGLWIQNEPEHAVIVTFTEDGRQTIQPYVEGTDLENLIEVRQVEYTLEDLQATQDDLRRVMDVLELNFATGTNIEKNTVEVYVTDMDLWETTLQRTRIRFPANFTVVEVYEPVGDDPPFEVNPPANVFMPQLTARTSDYMEALLTGILVVDNGCLRVMEPDNDNSYLVIWQADYYLTTDGVEIEVLDQDGQAVARVGAGVEIGGGEVPSPPSEGQLREPIPERCTGPYWLMGEIVNDR